MTKARLLWAVGIVAVMASVVVLVAQTPANPAFEVASVKPNASGTANSIVGFRPGGRFAATNLSVQSMIILAFRTDQPLKDSQVLGLPNWAASSKYDIAAKVSGDAPQDVPTLTNQMPSYLKTLLEARFALKAHTEVRDLPIYALTVAAADGHLGPHLRRSTVDCQALAQARRDATAAGKTPPPDPNPTACGIRAPTPGTFAGGSILMASLISTLSNAAGRVVFDRTNLEGRYDIDLEWAAGPSALTADPSVAPITDRPSIFTAVQEQLGLKLESTTGPLNVVVVDHVERPTED